MRFSTLACLTLLIASPALAADPLPGPDWYVTKDRQECVEVTRLDVDLNVMRGGWQGPFRTPRDFATRLQMMGAKVAPYKITNDWVARYTAGIQVAINGSTTIILFWNNPLMCRMFADWQERNGVN